MTKSEFESLANKVNEGNASQEEIEMLIAEINRRLDGLIQMAKE